LILIRRRAIVAVTLSIMIFASTVAVLTGLRSAPSSFAADQGYIISDSSAPTIFSSKVSTDLVGSLEQIGNITGAVPEIFAFSSWNGQSFVIRGVGEGFGDVGEPSWDTAFSQGSALIGSRLLGRLDMNVPFSMPLVGSYSSRMTVVNVTGSFEFGNALDDELLVHLEVARFLTGMPKGDASIIRVSTSQPEWLDDLLAPEKSRFTLYDLHTSSSEVATGQPLGVSVQVRNWGGHAGSIEVSFSVDGSVVNSTLVELNASVSKTISTAVILNAVGTHLINASIDGDFPVDLNSEVEVVNPFLRVAAPTTVLLNSTFNVAATTFAGDAAAGATVTFNDQTCVTGEDGVASFVANQTGAYTATVELSGFEPKTVTVNVVDPTAYPPIFLPSLVYFSLSPGSIKESERATGLVLAQNLGLIPGYLEVKVYVDSAVYAVLNFSLSALGSSTRTFAIEDAGVGNHVVQVGTFAMSLSVQAWFADNPDLVQVVIRYGGSNHLSSASSLPIYQAAKLSQGNISVALFAIGAIAALLAGMAITSVFATEISLSRRKLGILRTIGASRSDIRSLVLPQALENGLAGAALGIVFGVLVVNQLASSGVLFVFGHELALEPNPGQLLLILIGAVAISVASALVSAAIASRETAIKSIRDTSEESPPSVDANDILGNE